LIAKSHQRQLTAVAVAALLGLWGFSATALSLGRITVQSALGEPLRAEIDILDINADEAATLSTKVAAPEVFKASGLEFNPALTSLQATLQRRSDGRAYIRLSSDRTVNDPFVDMILETSWNSGRIVRDYTLLFDPPSLRNANAPTVAQLPAPEPGRPAATQPSPRASVVPPRELAPAAPVKPAVAAPKAPIASPPRAVEQTEQALGKTVTVRPGDTAGRIAVANKPASVSLDQMLVALLRANPDAFIQDNVNRIKAGAILSLPTEEQASATPPAQASQTIIAQSQDFNDFRRKFANIAPLAKTESAGRVVSGKVQATVEDKKPAATTPDKLTLSKGAVQGKTNEEQLARAANVKAAASRAAEIAKNISDLNKLAASSGKAATPPAPIASVEKPGAAATVVAQAVSAPASAPAAQPPVPPASPAASATPPVAIASAPAPAVTQASAPRKPVSAPPPPADPPPEPGFIASLLENPMMPAGAAGLIALLAGFGFYKVQQRKKAAQVDDSAFIESRIHADSFSGASGGQSVDTNDNLTTGSSMVYSPSQLDAVDDVDPVAEADVYLAYGRDLQAEEILKDALRTNPQRVAIHHKLLDIYAKRRDAKAFEAVAALAFNLTDGIGSEWEQICEKGLAIDPDNALYLPGGQPHAEPALSTRPAPLEPSPDVAPPDLDLDAVVTPTPAADGPMDLDLDLDFSLDEPEPVQTETFARASELPTLDFDEAPRDVAPTLPELADDMLPSLELDNSNAPAPTVPDNLADHLDFSNPPEADNLSLVDDDMFASPTQTAELAPTKAPADTDLMAYDLNSLSLELGDDPITEPGAFVDDTQDPLETKLALADEFRAIGDDDGARALIEEVIAESSGAMKAKAQRALSKL
jgi:pilus assembly protein FimV